MRFAPVFVVAVALGCTPLARAEPAITLRRGVNTSHWFAQHGARYPLEHLRREITARDAALMKRLGLDHVRFTLNPELLWRGDDPQRLDAAMLAELDRAIDLLLDAGLNVVVDVHPEDGFKRKLKQPEGAFVEQFAQFWSALAAHVRRRDPSRVALEIINESTVDDADRWQKMAAVLHAAIRRAAPEHTIIITGCGWGSLDGLLKLKPVDDANVIYTFHMYDPHVFTHQGATWGWAGWRDIEQLPYPATPENVAPVLAGLADHSARWAVKQYGDQRWNADRVERHIAQAADWAKRHGAVVWCGEFGVYRKVSPPDARAAYLHDVRTACERHGIGWAMWDWKRGFNLAIEEGGTLSPHEPTADALGLNVDAKR